MKISIPMIFLYRQTDMKQTKINIYHLSGLYVNLTYVYIRNLVNISFWLCIKVIYLYNRNSKNSTFKNKPIDLAVFSLLQLLIVNTVLLLVGYQKDRYLLLTESAIFQTKNFVFSCFLNIDSRRAEYNLCSN